MTKPIFLVGLPNMVSMEQIESSQRILERKLEGTLSF